MEPLQCIVNTDEKGRELINHGTALFPIACYHDDLTTESVPWHWHEEMEAGIVTKGQVIAAAGSQKFTLNQGDGFFINSGVLHAIRNTSKDPCRLHSLVFHPRLVGGSLDSIFWQKYVKPLLGSVSLKGMPLPAGCTPADSIECAWQSFVKESPGYEFQVRTALSRLLFLLTEHLDTNHSRPSEKALRDEERIKTMLQYIERHYDSDLNTKAISESALISPSECLRCFKSTIGTTPIQYVKQFRIQKAAELLVSTNQRIVDIGAACGFQEMSYFARTFREVKGVTPSEYRMEKQEPR